jgi:hypothetical protein
MFFKASVISGLCFVAASCADVQNQLTGRYGPAPVPNSIMVETAVRRQNEVVLAMAHGAGYEGAIPALGLRERWYDVILAGFNVVDDACMTYIDDLWILERRKNRNEVLLAASGAATAAILAASSHPSSATLVVLAQAFGLASAFNAGISDSYLYTQNAATIKKLVRKTTTAYRDDLAAKLTQKEDVYPVGSPGAAYHHMREYLALCLPPTIQAQIEDLVTSGKATPANSQQDAALTKAKVDATTTKSSKDVLSGRNPVAGVSSTTSIVVR